MEKLIEKIIDQLELIKNIRGIKHEGLKKALVKAPNVNRSLGCDCQAHRTKNPDMHHDWCSGINPARDKWLSQPKGSIDIGKMYTDPALNHNDKDHILNHHLAGKDSLKEIYDNNGGLDAVKYLSSHHGANGVPHAYKSSGLTDKLHGELNSINGSGRKNKASGSNIYDDEYTGTAKDLHSEVEDTFKKYVDSDELGLDENEAFQAHEDAVNKRAIEHFKNVHKIP